MVGILEFFWYNKRTSSMLWIRVCTSTRSKRFADKVFRRRRLEPAVYGPVGPSDHKYRKIAIRFNFLKAFHHFKSIHAGHLQIEQDQGRNGLLVKRTNFSKDHLCRQCRA